jgi:hypothetical protein
MGNLHDVSRWWFECRRGITRMLEGHRKLAGAMSKIGCRASRPKVDRGRPFFRADGALAAENTFGRPI